MKLALRIARLTRPTAALVVGIASLLTSRPLASAALANAWHIPDNTANLGGVSMRNPRFEVGTNTSIVFYTGAWKWSNSVQIANQTGGTLYFKGASQTNWSSIGLTWNNNTATNQYWRAAFNTSAFGPEEVIQYYFLLTFDGFGGVQDTWLFGGDSSSSTSASQATAVANPFTIRNRPAWLFHAGNRVLTQDTNGSTFQAQFWTKVGYVGKTRAAASRWGDSGAVYYTTDGSTPAGALGVGTGTTQTRPLSLDHYESDPSVAGDAMWWRANVTNLPMFTTIKYKIGLWHSANQEEKFADYVAGGNNQVFSFAVGTAGAPALTVNGLSANYTTTHVFVDEVAGDTVQLTILFAPNVGGVTQAEVFSNLNRRDRATQDANGDGIEDGIVPPDGNSLLAGDDSHYYKAYAMSPTGTPGQFSITLNAGKTGAYRLTARYKVSGNPNWIWYSSNGRRDHALVVSPKKARDVRLYELNALNIEAQGSNESQRSTFVDLWDGPGARPYNSVTTRFNLDYAQGLGVNWLWFQPIHPNGVEGRQNDPVTGQPYELGSPYAVKNFFEVNPLMSKAGTRAAAQIEFSNFVAAADSRGVNVMLDAAFNHTAWDGELAGSGVYYFGGSGNPNNWQATDSIRSREARFYSRGGDYCQRAFDASSIATAPDRGDFGKWDDVKDVFFGRYSALVCQNPSDNSQYLNEGDAFDTSESIGSFDAVTRNVWRYFGDYVLYWLDQTGCPAGTPADQSGRGIDGLRADFGQGLPPQCWEYIINKARSRKWDFVFMSESLDGGAVTYRSNRHFDILNENIVFPLKSAGSATDYRSLFEDRRNAYGQGLVLLNSTSHDEENYTDPFEALLRFTVCGAMDGALMIFYGQELGIARDFGFDRYEVNFGKLIPHFKKYNSLQPICATANRTHGLDQLFKVYAGVNQARQFSRALRSSNRWFLEQPGGGPQPKIFSVAKYETANASPNFADVVFAFANLDRNNNQQGNFNVNISPNGANLFGIKSGRTYNVRNIAAYTGVDAGRRNAWLIPGNASGNDLLNNGLFVLLKKVPTSDAAWGTDPFEAQYLKLYDVTPPPAPGPPTTAKPYALGPVATFTWTPATDPDGGIAGYHLRVGTAPGGSNVLDVTLSATTATATNALGATLYATVSAWNNAGIEGASSAGSAGVILLDPMSDSDNDGMNNLAEDLAGTNPLDANSVLRILSLDANRALTWSSVSGKVYSVLGAPVLGTNFVPVTLSLQATCVTTTFFDPVATNATWFYRIEVMR